MAAKESKVVVQGMDELLRKFRQLERSVQGAALGSAAMAGIQPVLNEMKVRIPKKTGTAARSLHAELTKPTETEALAEAGSDYEVVRWIELGTKAHMISPKDAKALFWKGLDHPVRKVSHPGTKPNPFMRPSLDGKKDEAVKEAGDALRDIILAAAQS